MEFLNNLFDLVKKYWIIIVIIVSIIVIANLIYLFFVKFSKRREEKKTNETPKQESVVDMSEEERRRYTDKIKFLEARVDELEDDIKVYEGEINEAKMSTLNLTQALREMQNGKPEVKSAQKTYEEPEDPVKIVNVDQPSSASPKVIKEEQENELPPQIVKLRDAVYTNVREVTARYRNITENTTQEEVNKIIADFNKAKTQLAQYKEIEKKYIKHS